MRYLIFAMAAIMLLACGADKTKQKELELKQKELALKERELELKANPAPAGSSQPECYALTGGVMVEMSLTRQGQAVSGSMLYAVEGKDSRKGTLRGQMRGDTLIADYTFMQEGENNEEKVVFLAKGDGFLEGQLPYDEQTGTPVYKPGTPVTFSGDLIKRVPCETLSL